MRPQLPHCPFRVDCVPIAPCESGCVTACGGGKRKQPPETPGNKNSSNRRNQMLCSQCIRRCARPRSSRTSRKPIQRPFLDTTSNSRALSRMRAATFSNRKLRGVPQGREAVREAGGGSGSRASRVGQNHRLPLLCNQLMEIPPDRGLPSRRRLLLAAQPGKLPNWE